MQFEKRQVRLGDIRPSEHARDEIARIAEDLGVDAEV